MSGAFNVILALRAAAAVRRARVPKLRAPQVDHQEVGPDPDPTLMVRKQGIGTITFDTTTGDTMVSGGTMFTVQELDDELSKEDVEAYFRVKKAEDDAAANASGDVYAESYASVQRLDVSDDVVEGREAAEEYVRDNARKWKNLVAVRYADAIRGGGWLIGGFLAG